MKAGLTQGRIVFGGLVTVIVVTLIIGFGSAEPATANKNAEALTSLGS
jgi:hypothetical protein